MPARQRWTLARWGGGSLATLRREAARVRAAAAKAELCAAAGRAVEAAVGLERVGQVVYVLARVDDDPLNQVHQGPQSLPPAAAAPADATAPSVEAPAQQTALPEGERAPLREA